MQQPESSEYERTLGYKPPKGCLKRPTVIAIERGTLSRSAFIVKRRFANTRKEEIVVNGLPVRTDEHWEPKVDVDVPCKTGGHQRMAFDAQTGTVPNKTWELSEDALKVVQEWLAEWERKREVPNGD